MAVTIVLPGDGSLDQVQGQLTRQNPYCIAGRRNIEVKAVAPRDGDLVEIEAPLHELGLEIENEDLIRHRYHRPFTHFGAEEHLDDSDAVHEF